MNTPAVLFALPIEASAFLRRLADLRKTGSGLYEGSSGGMTVRVGISGMGQKQSGLKARELLSEGAELLVVCGYAAGLDDSLNHGDLVVASSMLDESSAEPHIWMCDKQLVSLASEIIGSEPQRVLCLDEVVNTPCLKTELAIRSGCTAGEMESVAAVSVAEEFSVPLLVVRAIVDTVAEPMPEQLAQVVKDDGNPRIGKLATGLLRHPALLKPTFKLALSSRRCAHRLADFLCKFLPLVIEEST